MIRGMQRCNKTNTDWRLTRYNIISWSSFSSSTSSACGGLLIFASYWLRKLNNNHLFDYFQFVQLTIHTVVHVRYKYVPDHRRSDLRSPHERPH